MPAPLQFQSNGDERIAVAKGTDIRENNAHLDVPGLFEPLVMKLIDRALVSYRHIPPQPGNGILFVPYKEIIHAEPEHFRSCCPALVGCCFALRSSGCYSSHCRATAPGCLKS